MLKTTMAGLAAATLAVSPALAQDAYMSPMDFSAQTQALTSSTIGNISVGDVARGQGSRSSREMTQGRTGGRFSPSVRVSDARIPYASSAASQQQAMNEYLARARRNNPKAAAALAPELRQRNPTAELTPAFARYGLRIGDAADVMTVFLVSGYDIMTGRDSTPAQIRGVRRQVAGQLLSNPAMRNPATRTKFAEELKITTYIVSASEGSAKRDGHLASYRRGLGGLYRQITGENIAAWRITNAGFAK